MVPIAVSPTEEEQVSSGNVIANRRRSNLDVVKELAWSLLRMTVGDQLALSEVELRPYVLKRLLVVSL